MNMNNVSESLTIVVPVKNEERNLLECLENVKAVEHVVLVDSGDKIGQPYFIISYWSDNWRRIVAAA